MFSSEWTALLPTNICKQSLLRKVLDSRDNDVMSPLNTVAIVSNTRASGITFCGHVEPSKQVALDSLTIKECACGPSSWTKGTFF